MVSYLSSARFIRRLGNHSSLEGIWLLCIITIKYTADTAYLILRCQKVTGEGIQGRFVSQWLHLFTANILILTLIQ